MKIKLDKNVDMEDLDAREVKRIKTLKKRRKMTHSFLYAPNMINWEENIKHKDYCEIKPGAQFWFKNVL